MRFAICVLLPEPSTPENEISSGEPRAESGELRATNRDCGCGVCIWLRNEIQENRESEDCHHERSEGSVVCHFRQKSRSLATLVMTILLWRLHSVPQAYFL